MTTHTDTDLTFGIDEALGSVTRVGDLVIIRSDEPVAVWDAVTTSAATSQSSPADVAEELAERGVTVEITSPDGLVARLGAGADSARGKLVTGTRKVELGDRTASSILVRTRLHRGDPRLAAAGVGAVAAAIAVVVLRRKRRRKSAWELRREAATDSIAALVAEVRARGQQALPVVLTAVEQARTTAAPHIETARARFRRDVMPAARELSAKFRTDVVPAANRWTTRGKIAASSGVRRARAVKGRATARR